MLINKIKVNSILLYLVVSLTFLGFYAIVLILVNAGMSGFTREVTIPVRAILGGAFIGLFFLNSKNIHIVRELKWFLAFAFLYLVRVIIDYYVREPYYLSTSEILFYFISFSVIPFVSLISFRLNDKYLSVIINAIFFSGFIFAVLVFLFYSDFIGEVGRLTSSTAGEEVISPLILSYCATLIVGVIIIYLLYNKTGMKKKFIGFITIALSIVPFFLGASRGSLVALFVPFLFMAFSGMYIKSIIKSLGLMAVVIAGLIYYDNIFESGLLKRFFDISEAVERGSNSASRLMIWETSFNQFLDNPFFGDKLGIDTREGYAHNLFFEVLQTTGILGFIPFFILIIQAFKFCFKIFKKHMEYAWISVIFIQAFMQNMFSGATYSAAWLWSSMALLISTGYFLKKKEQNIR